MSDRTENREGTHDFGDGAGPVPARKHRNGGGWVAATAIVEDTAMVAVDAVVYGRAIVPAYSRVGLTSHAWR